MVAISGIEMVTDKSKLSAPPAVHILAIAGLIGGPVFVIAGMAFVAWAVGWVLGGGGAGGAPGTDKVFGIIVVVFLVLALLVVCAAALASGLVSICVRKRTRWCVAYVVALTTNVALGIGLVMLCGHLIARADSSSELRAHDKDAALIGERVEQYFRTNNSSIEPGGSQLRYGRPNGVPVEGSLKVTDLVDPAELKRPIGGYELEFERTGDYVSVTLKSELRSRLHIIYLRRAVEPQHTARETSATNTREP